MYSFLNDYSEGAHPDVLKALNETNELQTVGYGTDEYCQKAKEDIYRRIERQDADIHFFTKFPNHIRCCHFHSSRHFHYKPHGC